MVANIINNIEYATKKLRNKRFVRVQKKKRASEARFSTKS